MFQISANNKYQFTVDGSDGDGIVINDATLHADIIQISPSIWNIIKDLQSYNVEVIGFDKALKTAQIRVNNNIYSLLAKDQFDVLLDKMGLSNLTTAKIGELKAPMPGLVLRTFIKEGDAIGKGDNMLILEAMKMENIIKAPADAVVKTVKINPGEKVEKGQVLITFA